VVTALLCATQVSAAVRPTKNYDEEKVRPFTLPDPLVCADGTVVRDAATWRARRRPELLELFERNVYGRTPSGRLAKMHWAITSTGHAFGGKALRKEITIWFTEKDTGPQMHLLVYQPEVAGAHRPWPVFLGINYFGNESIADDPEVTISREWMRDSPAQHIIHNHATEKTRGCHASLWQVETLLARGYATATFYYGDICPDREDGLTAGVGPLFGAVTADDRSPDQWGAIGIWAWGLSRAMDYLSADRELDARRVAVHGHSRLGKAALWAAAQDERFALVISNESGCGGAKISRRYYGQTVEDITIGFPSWFCRNFAAFGAHNDALPVDQHELLALMAPRPLYVASAEGDRLSDPRGEFLGILGAEPVYALYGKKSLGTGKMPAVDSPVGGDVLAYHVRTGVHDITAYDWAQYLDFADRNLKRIRD
jgi:hypothetical protein